MDVYLHCISQLLFFLFKKILFELIMCTGIWNNLTYRVTVTTE